MAAKKKDHGLPYPSLESNFLEVRAFPKHFPHRWERDWTFPALPTAPFWRSLWPVAQGVGLGRGGWYLAKVLGGASAILMTQALVVLGFAVATLCCFLEVGKGGRVVPIPHVLCPCEKAQGVNTHSFPLGASPQPRPGTHKLLPFFLVLGICIYFPSPNISLVCHTPQWVLPSSTPFSSWQ